MKSKLILSIIMLLLCQLSFSQKGTIKGTLTDIEMNNEPLPFANVIVKGSNVGTTTDENGKYELSVPIGNQVITFSFLGYETIEVPVTIKQNEVVVLNKSLGAGGGMMLQDVVVETAVSREKESALLLEQKGAIEIKQSIGAQEMSRKGISDVAAAVVKTSGVSKQDGSNNVFVRGLGDRYNSTSMNGLPIPSNDPEKKNIALDLFSTDIVEYISIDKVYNTRTSGDFGGGNVDISSKDYRGNGMLEISLGSKVNTNSIEKNDQFFLQDGPNKFGFVSYGVPNDPIGGFNFGNSLNPTKESPYGGNFALKAGKSFNIGKEGKLNLFGTASFDNGFEFREGINQSVSAQGAKLKSFHQERFSYKTNSTGMFNANYRINEKTKIGYNFLHVNSSDQSRDIYTGFIRDIAEDDNGLVQRGTYIQNTVLINQLMGSYKFSDNTSFDWATSYNTIKSDMPDRTQNTLKFIDSSNGYVIAQNTITDNHRYYQNLIENEFATNLSLSHKIEKGKITGGYNGRFKKRDFEALQFNFRITGSQLNTVLDPDNLDAFFNSENFNNGFFRIETFTGANITPQTYEGEQNIHAGFANLEYRLSDKLSSVVGLRYENIEQTVSWRTQLDASGNKNTFERNEFLPSVILKYELQEKQNLRFGASKTYTLPQFKERALFIYEDVTEIKIGNPYLYPSQNYNVDLKWEMFPKDEELISVTAFGKYIFDPINEITLASATNDISFVNIGDFGYVIGAEFEIRKNIFSIESDFTNKLSAGLNASYMKTHQEIDSEKVQRETRGTLNVNISDETSGFTGASDLLLNADLSYAKNWNEDAGFMATIAYSYYSDRLYALGVETKGNLVDRGMGTLDFILKIKLSKQIGIDFTARNILNPEFRRVQENASGYVDALTFRKGAFFGLGLNYQL
jgi:hypothetical protein